MRADSPVYAAGGKHGLRWLVIATLRSSLLVLKPLRVLHQLVTQSPGLIPVSRSAAGLAFFRGYLPLGLVPSLVCVPVFYDVLWRGLAR